MAEFEEKDSHSVSLPNSVRWIQRLVMVLTISMIFAVLTITVIFIKKFGERDFTPRFVGVWEGEEIAVYNIETGALERKFTPRSE